MLCNVRQRLQSLHLADPGMAALLSALARGFELGLPAAPLG
ncbi:MAG: hypothetical protein QUV07_06460 [Cyanobium sp. CZS 25K]|nr:hypothetical protein [Cyanobium sp. CZS25K]